MNEPTTLIIGAGPAGLAVAGRLRQAGVPFEVIEKSGCVGNAWHEHYDRLQLHTVKELSHLPGLPFPSHYPRYVPRRLLADYYRDYAAHFAIAPRFGQEATAVTRDRAGWKTSTAEGLELRSRHVVIATGGNRLPHRPSFADERSFSGPIIHSRSYRNAEPFAGKRVLVVGLGNTGAEIALDLCDRGVEAAVSVRGPVNIVPRDVLGRPTQLTALALAKLPARLGDLIGVLLRRLTVGDLTRYGLRTPDIPPAAQLRLYGRTPVIDLGTLARIKEGRIRVYPAIDRFVPDGVRFADGRQAPFDAVILATGYRPGVADLLRTAQQADERSSPLDREGVPRVVVGEGAWAGVFFCGFDNHRPGGVLGTIVEESARIAAGIAAAAEPAAEGASPVPSAAAPGR